jgi:hypothetical protein
MAEKTEIRGPICFFVGQKGKKPDCILDSLDIVSETTFRSRKNLNIVSENTFRSCKSLNIASETPVRSCKNPNIVSENTFRTRKNLKTNH